MVSFLYCPCHCGESCSLLSRISWGLCRIKKIQLDAQLILSIFHQPLHVSGISKPIIRGTTVCIQQLVLVIILLFICYYVCCHGWINPTRMFVPPDDGLSYAQNL